MNSYSVAGIRELASATGEARSIPPNNPWKAVYIQAYATIKELFYSNLKVKYMGSKMRQISYYNALKNTDTYKRGINLILETLKYQGTTSWTARMELRMPYRLFLGQFDNIRNALREEINNNSRVYIFPSYDFAKLQRRRVKNIVLQLNNWRALPRGIKKEPQSITLALTLVYMLNQQLNSAPRGPNFKKFEDFNLENWRGNLYFIGVLMNWRDMKVEDDELELENIYALLGGIEKYQTL